MRRALLLLGLLALPACGATAEVQLSDAVAGVTNAANSRNATQLLAEARTLQRVAGELRASGDLTDEQWTRFNNGAVALQRRAGQVAVVVTEAPVVSDTPTPEEEPTPEEVPTPEDTPTPEPTPTPTPTPQEPTPTPTPTPTEVEPEPEPTEVEPTDDGDPAELPTAPTASPAAAAPSSSPSATVVA